METTMETTDWKMLIAGATKRQHVDVLAALRGAAESRGAGDLMKLLDGVAECRAAAKAQGPDAPWDFIGRDPMKFSHEANVLCEITGRWITQSAIEAALDAAITGATATKA